MKPLCRIFMMPAGLLSVEFFLFAEICICGIHASRSCLVDGWQSRGQGGRQHENAPREWVAGDWILVVHIHDDAIGFWQLSRLA